MISRRESLIAVPLFAVALMAGCGKQQAVSAETSHRLFVILMDVSASVTREARDHYKDYVRQYVVPSLRPGDRVIAVRVGDAPGTMRRILDKTLPPAGYDAPGPLVGTSVKEAIQECQDSFRQFKAARGALADELLGGFGEKAAAQHTYLIQTLDLVAVQYLAAFSGPKFLMFFSDMFESEGGHGAIDFERRSPNRATLDATLKRGVASLVGTRVLVVGATGGQSGSEDVFRANRAFWLGLFKALGGDASEQRYGYDPVYPETAEQDDASTCGGSNS
jgi:hypothetical protein